MSDGAGAADGAGGAQAGRDRVRRRLAGSGRVLVLTGAGVSAESGIPTFRGEDGWWKQEDPTKLATQAAFDRDPSHVWEWYEYRRGLVAEAEPNPAHRALASLERSGPEVLVATQNVDDLHERAGSQAVTHIHGSIFRVRCQGCGREREDRRHPLPERPPRCDACGGLERPAVVWFGEMLPPSPIRRTGQFIDGGVDVALVIGTEASFGYIQGFARAARRAGALLVEVNPSHTVLSGVVDVRLAGPAGEILPTLFER